MIVPNHRERQIMQYLRLGAWVRATALPAEELLVDGLVRKGWIEQDIISSGETCYRMAPRGLEAKTARIPTGQNTPDNQTNS
jgi:hypothetical protein